VDPGVEAHDVRDGNITSNITVSGTVDVNTTGTYTLTYSVSDAAGNEASITRTVNILANQTATLPADGLVAWYPLDQNASDMSGNGNHGILRNSPDFVTEGEKSFVVLQGYGNNSSDGDHILLPFNSFSGFTQITISGWVKFLSTSHSSGEAASILSIGDHSSAVVGVWAFVDGSSFLNSSLNATKLSVRGYQNEWVHFAISGDQSTSIAYVNGSSVGTGTALTNYSGGNAAIGRDWWSNGSGTSTRLNGSVDEIRIYNRTLISSEIDAVYQFGQ
jgi:hypothetical protein